MSLNLTLQTTLDYDSEFQSLMNTMIMVSNFAKMNRNVKEMIILKEQKKQTLNEMVYRGMSANRLRNYLRIEGKRAGTGVIDTIPQLFDQTDFDTEMFLKFAPITTEVIIGPRIEGRFTTQDDVRFTRGNKSYLLNYENIPSIVRLVVSSNNLRDTYQPKVLDNVPVPNKSVGDSLTKDLIYSVYKRQEAKRIADKMTEVLMQGSKKMSQEVTNLAIGINQKNKVIRDMKLRAGYVLMRQLGRN